MRRTQYAFIFAMMALALFACCVIAFRSRKKLGKTVAFMCAALIVPVTGNLIITLSTHKMLSLIGCYTYYLGMDVTMAALLNFTFRYCNIPRRHSAGSYIAGIMLAADAVQYALNPFFGNAFSIEMIFVDEAPYYRMIPLLGQSYHRLVDYGILFAVVIVFLVKTIRAPRIYMERYAIILGTLLLDGVLVGIFIFSRTPIDRSMLGLGFIGLLMFYFSLYYRPMKLLDRMLANIASEMPEALFFFEASGRCIWANKPAQELVALEDKAYERCGELLDRKFGIFGQKYEDWSDTREFGTGENMQYYVLEAHRLTDSKQRLAGSFLTVRDNSEEQRKLRQEIYNATHDTLTGLFTREYLYERIIKTLEQNPDTAYQVLFIDVKNFKIVNDVFSTAFGDYALCCIADWIRENMTDACVFGRLGGDTFGICMPVEAFSREEVEESLSRFIVRDGAVEYHILIHVGIYEVTEQGLDVSVMFDRAHLALSTIHDEYQTHIAYYDDTIRKKVLWDQHISAQLHDAISERQIRPYLQPIADSSGKVVGAEALARWIHPTDGFLSPAAFIPVFEQNGMIVEVDRHMWRCACEILKRWKDEGKDLFISVNISPKDFYFIDVNEEIMKLVKEYDIEPSRLRIEITETVMMNDVDERMKILSNFREAGFIVEMDDFGSGYSSLNLLKDMPVDVLKIDMKFLSKANDDSKAQTIVQNIIHLSDDLGISSLTEGVETELQYQLLSRMGCKLFQGYYFAKPLPVEEFEKFCS